MNPRKITIAGISVVLSAILLMNGCHSDSDSSDNNTSYVESESKSFTGKAVSFILTNIGESMLGEVGDTILGNLLVLLGWGDSSNEEEQKTLESIQQKLEVIDKEVQQLEEDYHDLMKELVTEHYDMKEDTNWPSDDVSKIYHASNKLQEMAEGKAPGEGNQTEIRNFANEILDPMNGIQSNVDGIFLAFRGNKTPILPNHVDLVLSRFNTYNDQNLKDGYNTLEQMTSALLNYQASGVNLIVEAYRVMDENQSAEIYFNDFTHGQLYNEVGNIDNGYSFIYSTLNMVLRNAPLYGQFLPDAAQSIFTQAKFYTINVIEHNATKYGLHLFDIRTDDLPDLSDTLYVTQDKSTAYPCTSVRHNVSGRLYDSWDGDYVKPSDQYKVTAYDCGVVPNGTYSIYNSEDLDTESLGRVIVSQYDTNYELNETGEIGYGFNFLTGRIDNHFQLDSPNWVTYEPVEDNYNSTIENGEYRHWPIQIKAIHQSNEEYVDEESKARVELGARFKFAGEQNSDSMTKMVVSYKMNFVFKVYGPNHEETGKNQAYAQINTGIWDINESRVVKGTSLRLDSAWDQENEFVKHYDNYSNTFEFIPQTGHMYSIYFDMTAYQCCDDRNYAEIDLNSIDHIYVEFSK